MMHGSVPTDTASSSSRTPRRGTKVALLGLVVLMIALTSASVAQAKVPKSFFGLIQDERADAKDYSQMHRIKVRTFRMPIYWMASEPSRGTFNWGATDARVRALAQNRITPLPWIWGTPQWATDGGNIAAPATKGKAKRAWRKFLTRAVKRYKPGGKFWRENPNLPKRPVESWQIWNEPNLPKYFAEANSARNAPKEYAKFIKASGKTIRKADKKAKVVLAGLSGNPKKKKLEPHKFIKKFLKVKKVKKRFDGAAVHPYAKSMPQYKSRISKFRKALKKRGAKKKEIWLTEVGWGSEKGGRELNKGLAGQARLLKKSFKQTLKKRKKWKIERLYWYDWRDPPSSAPVGCSFCNSAGLLRFDRTKKPAYMKFKQFTQRQGKG
jgi:GH35 family endo-1,4-beta-xylanase